MARSAGQAPPKQPGAAASTRGHRVSRKTYAVASSRAANSVESTSHAALVWTPPTSATSPRCGASAAGTPAIRL
eukprot:985431-Prymnesium_polylepis.1